MAHEINTQDADVETLTPIFDLLDGDWEADSAEAREIDRYWQWVEEQYDGACLLREVALQYGAEGVEFNDYTGTDF